MIDQTILASRIMQVSTPSFWMEIDDCAFSAIVVRSKRGYEDNSPATATLIVESENPRAGTLITDEWTGKHTHVVDISNGTLLMPEGLIDPQLELALTEYVLDLSIVSVRSRFDLNKRLYL